MEHADQAKNRELLPDLLETNTVFIGLQKRSRPSGQRPNLHKQQKVQISVQRLLGNELHGQFTQFRGPGDPTISGINVSCSKRLLLHAVRRPKPPRTEELLDLLKPKVQRKSLFLQEFLQKTSKRANKVFFLRDQLLKTVLRTLHSNDQLQSKQLHHSRNEHFSRRTRSDQ